MSASTSPAKTTISKTLQALEFLQGPSRSIHIWKEVQKRDSHACGETVYRALRTLRKRGYVRSDLVSDKLYWYYVSSPVSTPRPKRTAATKQSSKGSSGKQTVMCIDPTKPTLNQAIDRCVGELVNAQKPFSAHDVTKWMRENITGDFLKDIDPSETGTVHVNGKDVPKIEHDYIRDAVHELFHAGQMTGYDRTHNGTFWEYARQPSIISTLPPDDPSDPGTPPASSGDDYDGTPTL